MKIETIVNKLESLGKFLKKWIQENNMSRFSNKENYLFQELIKTQHLLNNWHAEEDIIQMLHHLSNLLKREQIENWIDRYPQLKILRSRSPLLVKPLINYPFAGIHEWLCCMITNTPIVLNANEDQYQILKFLCRKLTEEDNAFAPLIDIKSKNSLKAESFLIYSEKGNEALLQYFKNKRALIIEPRSTIGIITGDESPKELADFGTDIFMNLGWTSRSLRKLYVPKGYDVKRILDAIEPLSYVYRNNKYANNYDYHQSVFLMEQISFLDNGFLVLKEDKLDYAPTGCLFYEYYQDYQTTLCKLENMPSIENIICKTATSTNIIPPGKSHFHALWDYPNKKDLLEFLLQ